MPLAFNQNGPYSLAGQVFSAQLGTAQGFSVGLAIAYAGLGISNPVNSGAKVTILRANLAPIGTGAASCSPWGIAKLMGPIGGTTTMGTLSAFSGAVVCAGQPGTAATGASTLAVATLSTVPGNPGRQGTSVCTLFGTATVLNGTAGPSVLGLNYVEVLGVIGTSAGGNGVADTVGNVVLYPGETAVIVSAVLCTALAGVTWVEGSL
jgi:hypothetical protein